jgi:3'(2'), 5'-bisphosphate nucleotidase
MEINLKLIEEICQIANKAAANILEIYDTDFAVENKQDRSPLTAADMAAHNTICMALADLTPDIPVLSEESAELPYDERRQWSRYWLVDPLDGTREFIKRNGEFTVNIALIEKHQSILGVITVPVTGVCYYAATSLGAFKKSAEGITETIKVKTSEINKITVDIYPRYGLTSEWDTAAAQCIVEEAGGCVVDMDFKPIRYNTKESLLNPEFLVIADQSFNWKQYLDEIN